ncbi:MAG: phosphoenolpyruvate--protein phosphotransferase [candidate division Zixibacteria bacterium]|nr:phosphoenolpyruvate--protein phosphotransferase [candidate division Zixibacteria bacterium]
MSDRRKVIKGESISSGIVVGNARVLSSGELIISEQLISQAKIPQEISALDAAVSATVLYLENLRDDASKKMAAPPTKIFDAQALIAGDAQFLNQVKEEIRAKKKNAAHAYNSMVQKSITPLKESQDLYMRQLAQDIEAVARKVLLRLTGAHKTADNSPFPPNTILVSKSFTPAEIMSYRNRKAVGFIVGEGGKNSHMALIARSLMLPTIVLEKNWSQLSDNQPVAIDATQGEVVLFPTEEEVEQYQKTRKKLGPALVLRIKKLVDLPPKTADGQIITIGANLELPGPVEDILAEQNFPVGLYRTEFMYLEEGGFPSEEKQLGYYTHIAEKFINSYVVLRTFDLGSDKIAIDGHFPHEENPALGWRGIRSMLDLSDIFKIQIRAILRASEHKNLRILLPMISDLGEVEQVKKLISQVMYELKKEKIHFDQAIKIGMMVEVPSAALTLESMLPLVDFVAIGTNDLTQYTMSADRNNARVTGLYNPMHPSVLTLIKMTVDACLRHRKPVCICGEAAGDHPAIPLFIGMGITEFSMNPAKIFDVCRLIRKIDTTMVRALVGPVLSSGTASVVSRKLQSYKNALERREP